MVENRKDDMTHEDHALALGKITGNLLSLERSLRNVLCKLDRQKTSYNLSSLNVGDKVPLSHLSSFDSLGELIKKYNAKVKGHEQLLQKPIVELRDALAHGRVVALTPSFPLTLVKFEKPEKGSPSVGVVYAERMTSDWFETNKKLVYDAIETVYSVDGRLGSTT